MERGEHLKRKEQPTMAQMQYLLELEKTEKKKGIQSVIAKKCEVNASTVYRYFKTCIANGYLDEQLEFTESGRIWFHHYKSLLLRLQRYLQEIGGSKQLISDTIKNMLENIDLYMIELMLLNYENQKSVMIKKPSHLGEDVLTNIRKYEEYYVKFGIYRLNRKMGEKSLSMAMNGFSKRGKIIWKDSVAYLELRLKDMSAKSRLNGTKMYGHLDTLKYEDDGILVGAERKNNSIFIPLSVCTIKQGQDGTIVGKVAVTMTSSAGQQHMPESTALMIFWM